MNSANTTVEEVAKAEASRLKEDGSASTLAGSYRAQIELIRTKNELVSFLSMILAANSSGRGSSAAKPCREACSEMADTHFNSMEIGTFFLFG